MRRHPWVWWWDRAERTLEDERSVANLRLKMERIMRQLELTIEEMREALEEDPPRDPPGNGTNPDPFGGSNDRP